MEKHEESTNNSIEQVTEEPVLVVSEQALRKKAVLSGASALLVVVLILGAMLAWYTRLTNITGLTFDAAEFDINASYLTDSYILNPYTYDEIANGLSAPGVKGYAPVTIYTTAETNEVEVNYRLNIDTGAMASEFQERIRFYYYTLEDGVYVEHDLGFGEEDMVGTLPLDVVEVVEHIYWEWIYEGDISNILISPAEAYSSGTVESEIIYVEYDSLGEMTNEEIYNAIYNWRYCIRTAGLTSVETYYDELTASSMIPDYVDANTSTLYKVFNGASVTAKSITTDYGDTTYAAVAITAENYANKVGANLRDYIDNYVLYEWDYTDTQVAIGAWDETMTSENSNVFACEYKVDENGDATNVIEYYAYQMAMQVSIEITALQAEPLEGGETSNYPNGGGSVKLE